VIHTDAAAANEGCTQGPTGSGLSHHGAISS
jgi:hypothetical protein